MYYNRVDYFSKSYATPGSGIKHITTFIIRWMEWKFISGSFFHITNTKWANNYMNQTFSCEMGRVAFWPCYVALTRWELVRVVLHNLSIDRVHFTVVDNHKQEKYLNASLKAKQPFVFRTYIHKCVIVLFEQSLFACADISSTCYHNKRLWNGLKLDLCDKNNLQIN